MLATGYDLPCRVSAEPTCGIPDDASLWLYLTTSLEPVPGCPRGVAVSLTLLCRGLRFLSPVLNIDKTPYNSDLLLFQVNFLNF